jgi:hypothetical protein
MPRTKNHLHPNTIGLLAALASTLSADEEARVAIDSVIADPIIDALCANPFVGQALKNALSTGELTRKERRPILRNLCRAGYFPAVSDTSDLARRCITIDGQKYDLTQLFATEGA